MGPGSAAASVETPDAIRTKSFRMRTAQILTLAAAIAVLGSGSLTARRAGESPLDAAELAWSQGDYVSALGSYLRILDSPQSDAALRTIALQTGELYRTTEITRDGSAPRFVPDGRTIAYETGSGLARTTRLLAVDAPAAPAADLHGFAAAFAPDGSATAYLTLSPSPALAAAESAVAEAAGPDRLLRQAAFDDRLALDARVIVRDRATGVERDIPLPGFRKTQLALGAGVLWFAGQSPGDRVRQIYEVGPDGIPAVRTAGAGDKTILRVNAAGTALLAAAAAPPRASGASATFSVVAPGAAAVVVAGTAPAFSADGTAVTYVARGEAGERLMVAPAAAPAAATVVRAGPGRLDAPAFSPDGRRLAFQLMVNDDWEIATIDRDGGNEQRVTREDQHDVLPVFLGPGRLLAAVGEPRHRRSFLYDLPEGTRTRLFHNNTVRTIAPEYAWVPSADGSRVLIVADRDGDTVSTERGIYLVDLTRQVTLPEVRARVAANLAQERALRSAGARRFAPIAAAVSAITSRASVERFYGDEKALADMDSKYITEPGNARARAFIADRYASFGYAPDSQFADFRLRSGATVRSANVIAALTGTTSPDVVYVVSSHYDSALAGPGADDNSSGTAALLEAARLLAGHPQPATILFASFTGEEAGLLGSREFVRRAAANGLRIAGALNNDTVGWANDYRLDDTIRYSNAGIRDVEHAAAMQFSRLITYDSRYFKNTDAAAYYEAFGDIVGGLGSYPVLGSPHYHQPHDRLDTVNHQLVTEVARATVASVMLLASSPSPVRGLKASRSGDGRVQVSWTPSPERDVTAYVVDAGSTPRRVVRPEVSLTGIASGARVTVRAVNVRGMESWDAASCAPSD